MPLSDHPRIAVVADAHFHDIYGNYGLKRKVSVNDPTALRRLADTAKSTRVFNESYGALHYVLDDIAKRGIRLVVLLGDYSDDGQQETLAGLRRVLDRYRDRFGIRFFATAGNHDIFGADGRHRTKRYLNDASGFDTATSNPALQDPEAMQTVHSAANYCDGYPQALQMVPKIGFFGGSADLHWETPFGTSAKPEDRVYPLQAEQGAVFPPMMDSSYLVEPVENLWLLMIDANVFVPHGRAERVHHDEDYADSTAAGWNAMLVHKPFVLDWMKDVAARAKRLGKRLLAFSHYPVLDPVDGTGEDERALLGATSMTKRIPGPDVAAAILETGINVHFSGHVHVNDTARIRHDGKFLCNVAVPSLVAFPAGYKIVEHCGDVLNIETVEIGAMPVNPDIEVKYRREVAQTGVQAERLLGCADYGAFINEHIGHLVSRRHLRREWPETLALLMKTLTLADVAALVFAGASLSEDQVLAEPGILRSFQLCTKVSEFAESSGLCRTVLEKTSALEFLEDWYRLRLGSGIALDRMPPKKLATYTAIANLYAEHVPKGAKGMNRQFALLFRIFTKCRDGLPSRNFAINLRTGRIKSASES